MPLEKISSKLALENGKRDVNNWPTSDKDLRLHPFTSPHFSPSFQIEPDDKVFCMGSCFARNIEAALLRLEIDCVTARVNNPYAKGVWGRNNFLIRYNPYSMLNELTWALDPRASFPEAGFLKITEDLWIDPHNHAHYEPHPKKRLMHLRQIVNENTQRLKECRIFILTLGLVEAWFDHTIHKYTNICPDHQSMQKEPERFTLNVLNYQSVLEALEKIYSLLKEQGHPNFKMLLSVSPVPIGKTFRQKDVFTANMYSKSVLRSAAEAFIKNKENVDYYPSYESILYSEKKDVWDADQRHVTEEVVRFNITRMVQQYISSKAPHYKAICQPFVKREPQKSSSKKWFHFFSKTK